MAVQQHSVLRNQEVLSVTLNTYFLFFKSMFQAGLMFQQIKFSRKQGFEICFSQILNKKTNQINTYHKSPVFFWMSLKLLSFSFIAMFPKRTNDIWSRREPQTLETVCFSACICVYVCGRKTFYANLWLSPLFWHWLTTIDRQFLLSTSLWKRSLEALW